MDKSVSVNETTEILKQVFNFIKKIKLCENCRLEYLDKELPSLSIKRVGSAHKTKINIIGGYNAELPFIVYHKANVKDTKDVFEMTKLFDIITNNLEEETKKNFPTLNLPEGYTPIKLEMVESPEDASGKENNIATFMAIYKIHYKK